MSFFMMIEGFIVQKPAKTFVVINKLFVPAVIEPAVFAGFE
jgi:hypothetical protein